MNQQRNLARRIRYYSNLSAIYLLTVLSAWAIMHPVHLLSNTRTVALTRSQQQPHIPVDPKSTLVSGRPVRIVIPGSSYNGTSIDLTVDAGYYDSASGAWTLSGLNAQFAMISTLANNFSGDTFIYGHNNDHVFGALRHVTPNKGSLAFIYTDNGHILAYSFQSTVSLSPVDTSVLQYNGPPMLTIQTCTGSVNEWRTMYRYSFDRVIQ